MKTQAIVEITLKITLPDTWGPDSKLGQVYKQAADSAQMLVSRMILEHGKNMNVGIVGGPTVKAITNQEE